MLWSYKRTSFRWGELSCPVYPVHYLTLKPPIQHPARNPPIVVVKSSNPKIKAGEGEGGRGKRGNGKRKGKGKSIGYLAYLVWDVHYRVVSVTHFIEGQISLGRTHISREGKEREENISTNSLIYLGGVV